MEEKDRIELRCSFCGKSQKEVRKLIAGPTVYICDECIQLCNDIIGEEILLEEAKPVPRDEGTLASLVQAANQVALRAAEFQQAWAQSPGKEKLEESRLMVELRELLVAAARSGVSMWGIADSLSRPAEFNAEAVMRSNASLLATLASTWRSEVGSDRYLVTHLLCGFCRAAVEVQRPGAAVDLLLRWRSGYLPWIAAPVNSEEQELKCFDSLLLPTAE